jgi:hypothetical protein
MESQRKLSVISVPYLSSKSWKPFWDFPIVEKKKREGRRIRGCDASGGTVFEWYGESGAQLKYYPLAETATWSSPIFQLEPPPLPPSEYGLLARVKQYFPKQWQATE